jgi:hypothetical protein
MKAFVLYIEHDGPHFVSVHKTLAGARRAAREYAEGFFEDNGEECPVIEKFEDKLAENNEYARIYECGGEGGSIEVEPFAVAAEKQQKQQEGM